jgi:hypothetical protein
MSKINDGGPAFPIPDEGWPGMTLRDWFAGQALAGISAQYGTGDAAMIAVECYEHADAMLKAREVKP